MPRNRRAGLLIASSFVLLGACSGGGGGGGATPPITGASVPVGSGNVAISMVGTWEIRNAVVIDSNSSAPVPPLNGTTFVIEADRIASISGLSVDPVTLELVLGAQLTSYVNQVDGRTIFYGLSVDRRATGSTREEIAVAGGALDADTIAVEAYSSSQAINTAEPIFTLSRYQLGRVAPATPLQLGAGGEERSADDILHAAAGRD